VNDHSEGVGAANEAEYMAKARRLFSSKGVIRTYFRPDGDPVAYFNREVVRWGMTIEPSPLM
jgi:hypothetical protein